VDEPRTASTDPSNHVIHLQRTTLRAWIRLGPCGLDTIDHRRIGVPELVGKTASDFLDHVEPTQLDRVALDSVSAEPKPSSDKPALDVEDLVVIPQLVHHGEQLPALCCCSRIAGLGSRRSQTAQVIPRTARASIKEHNAQPKRIAEVGGIARSEAVQIEPAGELYGVFLRVTPDRRPRLRPHARKLLLLFSLAAEPLQLLIEVWGSKPRRAVPRGSGA